MRDIFTSTLRYKIWFDLRGAWQRTLQAVLTIAIGAFAVGTILGSNQGVITDTEQSWKAAAAPAIVFRVTEGVPYALVESLAHRPDLSAVEPQMDRTIEWRPQPDAPWQPALLLARDDFTSQKLAIVSLEEGTWPSGRHMTVERNFPVAVGDTVELRIDERTVAAPISGTVYNRTISPASLGGTPVFYTTREHFTDLTGQRRFQTIRASIAGYTPERAAAVAAALQADLEDLGLTVVPSTSERTITIDPEYAWFNDLISGIGFVMRTIGVVTMILSLLLVYNTVTAIITQQTAQIGELKAIGASSGQIIRVYTAIVFAYGLGALAISLPLGILAANGLRVVLVARLGVTPGPFRVEIIPLLIQVAICLLLPVIVAMPPILGGARITVREAISSYGLSSTGSTLDELLGRLNWLSRVFSLAISNAFRNWRRLLLTQLALGGAGVALVAVMSTEGTLSYASSGLFGELYRFPIQLDLTSPARLTRLEQIAAHPAVSDIEIWRTFSAVIQPVGQTRPAPARTVDLSGLPIPSSAYEPRLRSGRWLAPGDTYAIVLSEGVANELGVAPGDWLHIQLPSTDGQSVWSSKRDWQLVGVLIDPNIRILMRTAMAPRDTLLDELGNGPVGNRVQILPHMTDAAAEPALAAELRTFLEDRGVEVAITRDDTLYERARRQSSNIRVLTMLLMTMAVIIAAVGGIALSGVLSISVLERRREIGVLRAIGATPRTIRTLLITEGLIFGWLSWLIALAFSRPVGLILSQRLAVTVGISIIYHYSWPAVAAWLGLASLIGILASISPAQGAIRASVQESLAYE